MWFHTKILGFAVVFAPCVSAGEAEGLDRASRRSIEQDIVAREYHVGVGANGILSAPNRAQGLRVTFDADGITARPRLTDAAAFEWGLEFVGFGRGDALARPRRTAPVANENRVEYPRGDVVEWYLNDASGLEQGFTIATRPVGEGDLVVVLDLRGTLTPHTRDEAIEFATSAGAVAIRYDKLLAFDANGDPLGARMRLLCGDLRIEVDDRGARYPVTIDPLATSPAWTAESDQEAAQFAACVATAGDVNGDGYSDVVVGAEAFDHGEANEGRAFLYLGSAIGLAASPAWTAESNQASARFGFSVATAGDVNDDGYSDVIVGAYQFDDGQADEGRAYVYLGSASGLAGSPAWTAEGNQAGAAFGWSVATAGDVNDDGYSDVVVGAWQFDNGQTNEGRAFVYHGSAGGLAGTAAWTAESNQTSAGFGIGVETAGDVNGDGYSDLVVGAYSFDNGQTDEGRAFVYHGSAGGLAGSAAWTAESNQVAAFFGRSVATAGDVNGDGYCDVVVGAYWFDNGETNEGRVFVYHGSPGGLDGSAAWTAESDQASTMFGYSVATAGDVNGDGYSDVIVGAEDFDDGETDEGRAFVYLGSVSGLTAGPAWSAQSDLPFADFGHSVATAGDVNGDGYSDVIVGAQHFSDHEDEESEGWAFVYLGSAAGPTANSAWIAEGNQAAAFFGRSVATAGDVNGDGYSDVIVGAPTFDDGETNEGRTFVYLGSSAGPTAVPAWTAEGNQAAAFFGGSVATAGDVNGDGYADVIVGARFFDDGETDEGRAFVYHGSASGLAANPAWTAQSDQASSWFGDSVATAGDVNGDGYSDVVVGAYRYDDGETDEGRVFVYLGSASGLSATPAWIAEGNQAFASFGRSVAAAGDVNGDGHSDVIAGAAAFSNGESLEGRAFVFHGSGTGLAASPAWTAEGDQTGAYFGWSVAPAGDVNGDGFSDVEIGAIFFDDGQSNEGKAFAYLGAASGLSAGPVWTAESNQAEAHFGWSVASAGDLNGDGFSDLVVGAHVFDDGESDEGRAYVYLGSAAGPDVDPTWTAESNQDSADFGASVATAGDVNGDGYSDLVVAAPSFDNDQAHEGRVFVYLGNGGAGTSKRPRQRRVDDSAPISLLGRTTTGSYRATLDVRSPFGRGDARLAVESKPFGTPFDGSGLTFSPLSDTGTDGVPLSVTIGGLLANTTHRWRARIVHHPTSTPFLPAGPWFSIQGNGASETDLRTSVCGSTLATATAYGSGKTGSLGVPSLSSPQPPAFGAWTAVDLTGGTPFASPVLLLIGFAPAALPFDGGTIRVATPSVFLLPPLSASGTFSIPTTLPVNPATCGLHLYLQALFVDPAAAGHYHTAQTNGLDWMLGS